MRYLLLILLLAGGYYGWDYYQTGLVPRHEAIKAMEQEPYPELDAAQARFDEAAELHEQQAETSFITWAKARSNGATARSPIGKTHCYGKKTSRIRNKIHGKRIESKTNDINDKL